jgi:hypothetical protein
MGAIEPQSTWALAYTSAGIVAGRQTLLPPGSKQLPLLQLSAPAAGAFRSSDRLLHVRGVIDARFRS